MSQWKLVEAESLDVDEAAKQNAENGIRVGRKGKGNKGKGGRGNGSGKPLNKNNFYGTPYLSKQDRNYRSRMAVQQIENIFNADNLCMDTYIRSYMDEAGFVPIMLVYNYPNVAMCGALYEDVVYKLNRMSEEETCTIEADVSNEVIRLKTNWAMWLMPNQFGTMGQPRYVKQQHLPQDVSDTTNYMDPNVYHSENPYGYDSSGMNVPYSMENNSIPEGGNNFDVNNNSTSRMQGAGESNQTASSINTETTSTVTPTVPTSS